MNMNVQVKRRIDETLAHLSDQHVAEVLDFAEFLANKEKKTPEPEYQARIDTALALFREIVKSQSKGLLAPPYLDLTGFKFNRDEANER